jgi:hypothetical protein
MQNVKLQDIKSILESLEPKDLINLQNLLDAIALLQQLLKMQAPTTAAASAFIQTPNGIRPTTPARSIADINRSVADLGLTTQIQPNLREFTPNEGMISGISPSGREYNFTVNVNTGIGDPNAIAEAVDQVLRDAQTRGTLTTIGAFDR